MNRYHRLFSIVLTCTAWTAFDPPVFAQNSEVSPITARESKDLELQQIRESLEAAARRQQVLREEIEALNNDVGAINRALVTASARGHQLELQVTESEAALHALQKTQLSIRTALNAKRGLLAEVLGALQRMGSNPPPALLVQPEDALASVRSALLLGAVVPSIKTETDEILSQLAALKETTEQVEAQKKDLADRLNALAEDETRLTLLVKEKNQLAQKSRSDLAAEHTKAVELGEKAKSLEELIASLETEIASAAAAAEAARIADEKRKRDDLERLKKARERLASIDNNTAALPGAGNTGIGKANSARIEPAIAFSKARGSLPKPAAGVVLFGFGDRTGPQSRSSGMAFATRPNARVRAPSDSWVVYAGPFRSYGQILILNAGENYHVVMSGLSEVNVEPGRFVLAGEPVGRMGTTRAKSSVPVELGSNRPVLTVELRKDGKPVDPAPWWAPDQALAKKTNSGRSTKKGADNDS